MVLPAREQEQICKVKASKQIQKQRKEIKEIK
jgi:hypothetical protein